MLMIRSVLAASGLLRQSAVAASSVGCGTALRWVHDQQNAPPQQARRAGWRDSDPLSPPDQSAAGDPSKKGKESYDTTPLIMDLRGTTPLKSADYPSSHDDKYGTQRLWFTSLYKQLNYFAKTGVVPGLKGRQKEVFEAVEKEFEGLYIKHITGSGLKDMEHRSMLMMMLSIATYRILNDEFSDPALVRDVIRTNQGSMMVAVLLPLQRLRTYVLRYLLAEEPYSQAVRFLPAVQSDMGALCEGGVRAGPQAVGPSASSSTAAAEGSAAAAGEGAAADGSAAAAADGGAQQAEQGSGSAGPAGPAGPAASSQVPPAKGFFSSSVKGQLPDEVSLVIDRCKYHEVLTQEDATFLLSEFCCHHGMTWLQDFKRHGVDVSLERSFVWEDECCQIRVARPRVPGSQ
ncbi:hypothetical protein FOA52_008553 [Chlamydomonas sp. UWO 241]|nr:hypothetical protein FOA52_008553 [Chlamydomonas sp. UWO 241]